MFSEAASKWMSKWLNEAAGSIEIEDLLKRQPVQRSIASATRTAKRKKTLNLIISAPLNASPTV
jgi:FlaA1/EpsC-like NDP-sugar epimerase